MPLNKWGCASIKRSEGWARSLRELRRNLTTATCERSRRDFLKGLAALGALPFLNGSGLGKPGSWNEDVLEATPDLFYKARALSVGHFKELQNDIDSLRRGNKLSHNKTYRSYLDSKSFTVPPGFPEATSVLIVAVRAPMLRFDAFFRGRRHPIVISPQYFDDGVTLAGIEAAVRRDIVKNPSARLEPAKGVHLKLMAVRSGLGRYGRNNICYVEGMGTFLALFAFLTDAPGLEDSWQELAMLEACRECAICYGICPTNAIRREEFVIDAGRCITLYNEVNGVFPNWILPSMHNALMGCMKCQLGCPENERAGLATLRGEDIDEEETAKILEGRPDDRLLGTLSRKLRGFPPASDPAQFPILTRNLRALLHPGVSEGTSAASRKEGIKATSE
jgi:epoxyqueuosine reductase